VEVKNVKIRYKSKNFPPPGGGNQDIFGQPIPGISSYPCPPPVWDEVDCEKLGEIYFADY